METDLIVIAVGAWAAGAAWLCWQVYKAPTIPDDEPDHSAGEDACPE